MFDAAAWQMAKEDKCASVNRSNIKSGYEVHTLVPPEDSHVCKLWQAPLGTPSGLGGQKVNTMGASLPVNVPQPSHPLFTQAVCRWRFLQTESSAD